MTSEIVLWRIRNRIIEYLDLAASAEDQIAYQAAVPDLHVPSEVANQWEDWVRPDWRQYLKPPVFSHEEVEAVDSFNASFAAAMTATKDPLPPLGVLLESAEWGELRDAASAALEVFRTRGHRPEADLDESI
ncbi:hypothetical protein [Lysobacter auxotrophicus]|uniref:Uncharacterized protein n=1 Tax=Lysobacter auxotrophicus TaxID=2992573 RepID=A0ABM8DHQ2_9GAMM|nr:hypothetical protein [Lysobacter auxotrophicus]BDU18149.1 hypothetical protein LA521A_33500 [Lysobacter auxotrophicus]